MGNRKKRWKIKVLYLSPLFLITLLFGVPIGTFSFDAVSDGVVLIDRWEYSGEISHRALLFADREGRNFSIEELLQAEADGRIAFSPVEVWNLGISDTVWWLKMEIASHLSDDVELLFQLRCPYINQVDAWYFLGGGSSEAEKGVMSQESLGRLQYSGGEGPNFRFPVLPLRLPGEEQLSLYLRLESTDNIYLDLVLSSWARFMEEERRNTAFLVLVYGIITAMILFNFILLTGSPDRIGIIYLAYLVSILLYLLSADGTLFRLFLWRIPWLAQRSNYLFSIFVIVTFLLFTRLFLDVPHRYPRADLPIMGFIILGILLVPFFFFCPCHLFLMYLAGIIELLFLIFILYLSLRALAGGNRQARYYLLSWGLLIFLVGLTQLRTLGFLSPGFLTVSSLNLGLAFQVVILSVGLADRIRILDKENLLLKEERKRIEEEQRQKNDLLINISHELRTPLTIIRGIHEDLWSGKLSSRESGGKRALSTMGRGIDRILSLVGRISNLMRSDARVADPVFEAALVLPLLEEVARYFLPWANRAGLSFRFESQIEKPVLVEMDGELLRDALSNLVQNAIGYTRRGGVEVILDKPSIQKGCSTTVRIRVIDTGIGIPPEERESIFHRFYRTSSAKSMRSEGLGVGLSMVKEIIELHNGRVFAGELDSDGFEGPVDGSFKTKVAGEQQTLERRGRGSVFTVLLPVYEGESLGDYKSSYGSDKSAGLASSGHTLQEEIKASDRECCRILLIEDDRELLDYLEQGLSQNFSVKRASSAEAALSFLDGDYLPDLVVSDIMMGEMDGIALFRRLRSLPSLASVPFLFISARDQEKERIDLMNEGAEDYLVKPFSIDYLEAKIFSILRSHKLSAGDLEERIRMGASRYSLTSRQVEIVRLLLQGKGKAEIADALKPLRGGGDHVSVKTVDNHIQNIYRILEVHSHTELLSRFFPGL
jgi:two-component system, sensor histidine kinase LadS